MFNGGSGFGLDIGALLGNLMAGGNRNGSGFGDGNGWWVLIILFALFSGWGRNGFGNGNDNGGSNGGGNSVSYIPYLMGSTWQNGALTRADLCQDMNFQEVQNGIRDIATAIPTNFANLNSTICNQQYDTARMINGLQGTMQNGFNAANVVALQNQNALQALITQCCCDEKSLFAQAEYNRATDTCAITNAINQAARDIIQNDNCNYRQLHDEQVAQRMADKDAQIAQLTSALNRCDTQNIANAAVASAVDQVAPRSRPTYLVPNPNGCGCQCQQNAFNQNQYPLWTAPWCGWNGAFAG